MREQTFLCEYSGMFGRLDVRGACGWSNVGQHSARAVDSERSVGMVYIAVIYVVMSLVTIFVYWRDKRAAVLGGGRRRVPERTLHLLALFGGIVGALIAQQLVRHKRRKFWFMVVTVLIAALHAGGWVVWVWWRLMQ